MYIYSYIFICSCRILKDDTHLIIASDGIWDVISDDEAAAIVLGYADDPTLAAEKLKDTALENSGTDNISVMVLKF
jgi:serine/threonine protein phosphatase PrpC